MADILDVLNGLQLFVGLGGITADAIHVAVDKLDGLEKAARSAAFPNLAEATAAERRDQSVTRNRLCVGLFGERHPRCPRLWCRRWCLQRSRRSGWSMPRKGSRSREA